MHSYSISLLCILSFFIASCDRGWTEEDRRAFVDKCMAAERINERPVQQDVRICNCLFQKMSTKYPNPKDTTKITYHERIEWGAKCLYGE